VSLTLAGFAGGPFDAGAFEHAAELRPDKATTNCNEKTLMRLRTYVQTPPARLRWALLLVVALALTLVEATGCRTPDGPKDVAADIAGTYALADVGGNRLPTSIYQGPYTVNGQKMDVRIDVVGSTLQLDATRYVLRMQFQVAAQGQTVPLTVTDAGSYTKTADAVSFTSDEQKLGRLAGSTQNGELKVSIDLVGDGYPPTYLFRK
jgi:hypothetical protein